MIKWYTSAHVLRLPRSIWSDAMNKIIPVLVMKPNGNRIICLSNIFDPHYHDLRGEKVERCLTTPYRRVVERRAARCSSGGMGTP